ncbi:MAG: hypothetical protein VCD66_00545, partial [Alphaproteobacteria bacterium]
RINQFIFPFHTMISSGIHAGLRSFVPIDDEWAMLIAQTGQPGTAPISEATKDRWEMGADPFKDWHGYAPRTNNPRSYFYTVANRHNDYLIDPKIAKESLNIGMPFIMNLQDRAMTELMMGPNGEHIYDRPHEHLGTSDAMIIAVRKQLIEAAEHFDRTGELPANVDDGSQNRVRCATLLLDKDIDWIKASETARAVDESREVTFEHHLVPDS